MTRPETAQAASAHRRRRLRPDAAVLAWVLPGLGHAYLGQKIRGLRIAMGMSVLILTGLFFGGVDVVDARQDRLWFLAQIPAGPIVIGTDVLNSQIAATGTEQDRVAWRSLNNVNAIAVLSVALAGLMNIFVILDALYPPSHEGPRRRHDEARPDAVDTAS